MTLALTFITPLLLLGVAAAAIPFVLHLLSSVRAQEVYFPTLRFLRTSMERTARKRRIQHWLLLLLRAALLALLALAVAQPISEATGGWLGTDRHAAAIVLDNSLSMAVRSGGTRRFDRAISQATALLGGEDKPALATVLQTNNPADRNDLTASLDELRTQIDAARIGYGRAPLDRRVAAAVELLRDEAVPRKAVYVFSDLQRVSFAELAETEAIANADDVHLLLVDTAATEVGNVGIRDVRVEGQRVVEQVLEITATLINSSPTDKVVDVALRIDGRRVGPRIRQSLRAAGREGSTATVRFDHRFSQAGPARGELVIEQSDDLSADNIRRFTVDIGDRVNVLVVRGRTSDVPARDPAALLEIALDPYGEQATPWSIRPRVVEIDQLNAGLLDGVTAAFFCEVPTFTDVQAQAIVDFTRRGGTSMFFLGQRAQPEAYNHLFLQQVQDDGGLLPMKIGEAIGQVGPAAPATGLGWVNIEHPYFAGLYANESDYLTGVVQRYYRLAPLPTPAEELIRLENGDVLLAAKPFGHGRVLLSATTAAPTWTNLPAAPMFLPMVMQISLQAGRPAREDAMYIAGQRVIVTADAAGRNLGKQATLVVTPPADDKRNAEPIPLPLRRTPEGYRAEFTEAHWPGFYEWRVETPGGDADLSGGFAINPAGEEMDLKSMPADVLRRKLAARGLGRVYVGGSLDEARQAAAADAQGRNWWDVLLVTAILLLVAEAVVSNRRSRHEEAVPAYLNPKLAA